MAWDIYGDVLETGCCEVHPWINEEYPCHRCMQEKQNYEASREYDEYCDAQAQYLIGEMLECMDGGGI